MPFKLTDAELVKIALERIESKIDKLHGISNKIVNYCSSQNQDESIFSLKQLFHSRDYQKIKTSLKEMKAVILDLDQVFENIEAEDTENISVKLDPFP